MARARRVRSFETRPLNEKNYSAVPGAVEVTKGITASHIRYIPK